MVLPRCRVEEKMDAPDLSADRHRAALAGLRRLNRISGVSSALFRQLVRLSAASRSNRPLRVLDVASGSGDLPIDWLKMARRRRMPLAVTALDRSELAMQTAADAARREGVELGTVCRDCLRDGLPSGFDVVTSSLFMHHLDPPDVSKLIQEMWRVSNRAIVICDLERSRVNLGLIATSAHLVTRSDVVHFDASASVRAAYTRGEFATLLHQALGFSVPVKTSFPCRFIAVIDQQCEAETVDGYAPAVVGAGS
ncbi:MULTISPECIES: methyltransferase domain-containing protein [Pirellulaceae]|uniref:2-polyprenyl-3-methyl-5-hydroxy-6-metoxy-1, 4-benzoquinol methylase n=1 Tax=Aporhodopirellula rubra TaxID=980271 RepID=A0A7W5H7M2_9BACT|nr:MULTISPECIES: methyltransferase domain-containing protein [Pirellulaceae]EMI41186.1 Methyltransferase type 11 [Rhodopirellula sp. SWK7]MBB3208508.1 2-polyprenyl-3-methyl-5-hydroxy-6-metoxy-1,4-benzoquinol methylase [Aporhodopirellula rubra]